MRYSPNHPQSCPQAAFLGVGDLHDPTYSDTEVVIPIATYAYNETIGTPGHCAYSFSLYFSNAFESEEGNNLETICAVAVALIFAILTGAFCMYDRFVHRRNEMVVGVAARSNEIISSLFPTQVRDRLFAEKDETKAGAAPKSKLKSMLVSGNFSEVNADGGDDADFMYKSKPIADLFPETTILFADIVGFTAWSSVRAPEQVFILLETLYRAFDEIAKKRRVFKVSDKSFW